MQYLGSTHWGVVCGGRGGAGTGGAMNDRNGCAAAVAGGAIEGAVQGGRQGGWAGAVAGAIGGALGAYASESRPGGVCSRE